MTVLSREEWDAFLQDYPEAHLLQTSTWGLLKAEFGWQPVWIGGADSGAQVLFRKLPLGWSIAYLPKGPVGEDWGPLWPEIDQICRQKRAILLKVEPDAFEPMAENLESRLAGFLPNALPVQPRRTIIVDLRGSEEQILARMKQKTRYNIKLAERKGILVRQSNDLGVFYRLMERTGARDGFGIHTYAYYQRAYDLFSPGQGCVLLMAEFADRPLAGLMAFARGSRAWYFYGASSDEERQRMPTYLLQWEAMRWAKSRGCATYDLWGVPDEEESILEKFFEERSDGLWGVYRFKRGFGGQLKRAVCAWEKVYQPVLYRLYRWWLRIER